jgi:tetratricopeptide (TPR) repeat protein
VGSSIQKLIALLKRLRKAPIEVQQELIAVTCEEQRDSELVKSDNLDLFSQAIERLQEGDLKSAEATLEQLIKNDPQDQQALVYYGMVIMPHDFQGAGLVLDRALALSPDDSGALYWAGELRWLQRDWDSAIQLTERLARLYPAPQNWGRLGFIYKEAGLNREAVEAFSKAAKPEWLEATSGVGHKEKGRSLFYLDQLEDKERFSAELASLYNNEPLPSLPEGLLTLRNQVEGRDIAILANGPSLGLLGDYLDRIDVSQRGMLRYFGFNNVPIVQQFLEELGVDGVDFALMSHSQSVKMHEKWLIEFIADPKRLVCLVNGTLSKSPALQSCAQSKPDQFLFYNSSGDHPSIPGDPLHFPPINTLMHVLPMAVLGRPRSIFLFGCDGGVKNTCYFREGDAAYGDQPIPGDSYAPWLRKDTFLLDNMIGTLLQTVASIWHVDIPPIFNCCPDSRLKVFPRISADEFGLLGRGEGRGLV